MMTSLRRLRRRCDVASDARRGDDSAVADAAVVAAGDGGNADGVTSSLAHAYQHRL